MNTKSSTLLGIAVKWLLPTCHRAQILGDLEERGFQWRDIASAIPSAWIAHLRREWVAPVPNLTGATDEAIRLRTEQLQCGSNFGVFVWLCVLSGAALRLISPELHGFIVIAPGAVLALVLMLLGLPNKEYPSFLPLSASLLKEYRAALNRNLLACSSFVGFLMAVKYVLRGLGAVGWLPLIAPGIVAAMLLMFYRHSRILREIRTLPRP